MVFDGDMVVYDTEGNVIKLTVEDLLAAVLDIIGNI